MIRNRNRHRPTRLAAMFMLILSFAASGQNYIRTTLYCSSDGDVGNARISTTYFDGLGRERLSVSEKCGGSGKSVAAKTDYDTRGNVLRKWLPVPGGEELLQYKVYDLVSMNYYGRTEIAHTTYDYEENGLNRPIKETGPGLQWKGHPKKISRQGNEPGGKNSCRQFVVETGTDGVSARVYVKGNYPSGSLRVECVTDEDGKELLTFRDRLDRVVLLRAVSKDNDTADTYYIYDDTGDLRYALSPRGSALLPSSGYVGDDVLHDYAQTYAYDLDHRCISASAPGCGTTHYVYDKLGRVIFESTATQRQRGEWTMTKYDSRMRPAIRGLVSLPGKTREALQNEYGNYLLVEDPDYKFSSMESNLGYPRTCGPAGFQPYIAWMYDGYDYIVGANEKEKTRFVSAGERYTQNGLCTGIITKTDINSEVYIRALKYDHNGNVVRSCFWDLNLQDFRLTDEYEYDFVGNEIKHIETYESIQEGTDISEKHQATTDKTYDVQGRLLTSTLSVDNSAPILLQNNQYDEIGRLQGDAAGAGVQYGYDIRSNLTEIAGPVYTQQTWYGETPGSGSAVSFLYANATRRSWGKNAEYSHLEEYAYDGFGHFREMTTDNKLVSEKMVADINGDVGEIVRTYRGDVVQDAVMQFDGSKPTVVRDVSMPYWKEAVASFAEGDYILEYDADGRLVKDETRDITSITYQPFGNLPKWIYTGDGSYANSIYFSDGTLKRRNLTTRTIEIVTKVDSKGDTVRTERARNIATVRSYCGNYEWDTQKGCLYHTGAGHYSVRDGRHYWYVRDRLGSTVAVTDKDGNLLQATGYYPSGTPYQLPSSVATEVDAKTDQLHIGNRWIGHKGLDLYDNTARMHDPLLARFHTVDPKWRDYPSQSPWSHCAANPINFIDPNGLEWRQKKDVNGYTLEYEWVEGKDARDEKGNLLPGVYEIAILFTAEGKNGKKFDPNSNKNIGSSQAIVYGKNGPDDIHTFDACTYPSDIKEYAIVPEGDYEAEAGKHKSYDALRLGDKGTEKFNYNRIDLGAPNPSNINTHFAYGINIHKPGGGNVTKKDSRGNIISKGCLLIDYNRWDEFIQLFPQNTLIGVTIKR